jgi:hypothetical protein
MDTKITKNCNFQKIAHGWGFCLYKIFTLLQTDWHNFKLNVSKYYT